MDRHLQNHGYRIMVGLPRSPEVFPPLRVGREETPAERTVHGQEEGSSWSLPLRRFASFPFAVSLIRPPYPLKKDEKNYCQNLVDSLFIAGTHRLVPPVEQFFIRQ